MGFGGGDSVVISGPVTITGLPAALGQALMANSLAVVLASDQSKIPIHGSVASGTADADNPLLGGGVYKTTQDTYTDGQRGRIHIGSRGSQNVTIWDKDSAQALKFNADNNDAIATQSSVNKPTIIAENYLYNGASF